MADLQTENRRLWKIIDDLQQRLRALETSPQIGVQPLDFSGGEGYWVYDATNQRRAVTIGDMWSGPFDPTALSATATSAAPETVGSFGVTLPPDSIDWPTGILFAVNCSVSIGAEGRLIVEQDHPTEWELHSEVFDEDAIVVVNTALSTPPESARHVKVNVFAALESVSGSVGVEMVTAARFYR